MEMKIILVSVLLIAVLAGLVVIQEKKIRQLHTERQQALAFANAEKSTTSFYINKLGRETTKSQILDLSLSNARQLQNNDRLKFIAQFDGINKRLNNLDEVSQAHLQIIKDWKLPLRDTVLLSVDSTLLPTKVFAYKDSLNSIRGTITGKVIQPRIEITVPLQGVMYWQRNKILGLRIGRKKWFSDITSTNPFVKIKSQETIRINRR
jgi:hypothetical protein